MTNMSDRIYLSEQEILQKYGQPVIVIRNAWTHSDVYYDAENNQFIEERYHEEYLDTGTVCDGCFSISDEELWDKLVTHCNEEGMSTYLKYREHKPMPLNVGEKISTEDFYREIHALRQNKPWRQCSYVHRGSTMIITDEAHSIIGVVGKTDHYSFYFDLNARINGFHTLEEALAFALKQATIHHNYRVSRDNTYEKQDSVPPGPPPNRSLLDRLKRGLKP